MARKKGILKLEKKRSVVTSDRAAEGDIPRAECFRRLHPNSVRGVGALGTDSGVHLRGKSKVHLLRAGAAKACTTSK